MRGGFGSAFRRVVCVMRDKECRECLLKEKCVYSYVFETPPPEGTQIMRKYEAAPHPFIIEPPQERKRGYTPGQAINFGLTLIGRAIDYLPYFIYAFDELGKTGLGKGRGKFELKTVKSQETGVGIYSSDTKTLTGFETGAIRIDTDIRLSGRRKPRSLTLTFLTPTRITYDGSIASDVEFHMLIRNLLRRISLLSYFHCNNGMPQFDFKALIEKSRDVKAIDRKLRWYEWERYSGRQERRINMGGFVGEITFEGDVKPFMQLIEAGEVLHAGKGTSFGLGRYRVEW